MTDLQRRRLLILDHGRLRLSHALLGEALPSGMLPGRRRAVHRRVADILAAEPDISAAEVAHLYTEADAEMETARWSLSMGPEERSTFDALEEIAALARSASPAVDAGAPVARSA